VCDPLNPRILESPATSETVTYSCFDVLCNKSLTKIIGNEPTLGL
jgi:hypothetical protein